MLRIVIPMAGQGSRFVQAGYTFPKPLIDIQGSPMIQKVVENLYFGEEAEYIFLAQKEHVNKYNLESLLKVITKGNYKLIIVDKPTEGAACTVLLAKDYINNNNELIIANSDQLVDFDYRNFNIFREWTAARGLIFCFNATHSKWSFIRCDQHNKVCQVAEKDPISDMATCGVYYFRRGSDFVSAAAQMIKEDNRVNGEFYIAPTFNYLLEGAEPILPFFVSRMIGLGTPEDLSAYIGSL